jgi:NAD(P)-dependent dehydrogenase (short-subunit alcohol dehydrogenase family)
VRLAGKLALVTGAAQGLGAGIAAGLAREGARVMVSDVNHEGAAHVADQINAELGNGAAFSALLDVTSEDSWKSVLAETQARLGGLSILVNNAGIVTLGSVEDLDLAAWRQAMTVNVDSVFLGCKYAMPYLKASQPASIINLSSVSALIASHNMAAYNASKAAMWMLSKSVALHCAKQGWNIRSNSIHPTFVRTALLDGIIAKHGQEAGLAKLARQVPIGRIGEVPDVVAAAVYLASDESSMMTGAEMKLDGGITAM